MSSKNIGASELMAQLKNDPEFQKQKAQREAARKKASEEAAKEERELVKELNTAGCNVSSVWDLVNTSEKYKNAIPVLKKHLDFEYYSKGLKEGIYRALTVRWLSDKEITDKLFNLFQQEEDDNLRWVIGNTLSVVVKTKEYADKALSILENKNYGHARSGLVDCYSAVFKQESIPKLIEFLQDKDLLANAITALGKLKAKEAKPYIEPFIKDKEAYIRNKAKSAIKKIG